MIISKISQKQESLNTQSTQQKNQYNNTNIHHILKYLESKKKEIVQLIQQQQPQQQPGQNKNLQDMNFQSLVMKLLQEEELIQILLKIQKDEQQPEQCIDLQEQTSFQLLAIGLLQEDQLQQIQKKLKKIMAQLQADDLYKDEDFLSMQELLIGLLKAERDIRTDISNQPQECESFQQTIIEILNRSWEYNKQALLKWKHNKQSLFKYMKKQLKSLDKLSSKTSLKEPKTTEIKNTQQQFAKENEYQQELMRTMQLQQVEQVLITNVMIILKILQEINPAYKISQDNINSIK